MNNFRIYLTCLLASLTLSGEAIAACTANNANTNVTEETPTADFADNGDGTVTHKLTGLTWDRCSYGQSWDGETCDGTPTTMTWPNALKLAVTENSGSYLGYSDWRLPNIRELASIVEPCGSDPTINLEVFPNTDAGSDFKVYWSSTSVLTSPNIGWHVHFSDGSVSRSSYTKTPSNIRVRLVRGGKQPAMYDLLAPALIGVTTSNTTLSATTLLATADMSATGYWLAVPHGSSAPTPEQVMAGVSYGDVSVSAAGSGSMSADVEAEFSVSGLSEGSDYDLYLVAHEANNNANSLPSQVTVSTLDATPDPFTFIDQSDAVLNSVIASNPIVVSGITTTATVTVSGGVYSINEGDFTQAEGVVSNGDAITVQVTSSSSGETAANATLTINGVSDTFTVTTEADTDGDGIGNSSDGDDDGDGVSDGDDAFPLDATESVDTDGDGIGNSADDDDDGDGVSDADDAYPLDATRSSEAGSGGGGGAFGLWALFSLFGFALMRRRR